MGSVIGRFASNWKEFRSSPAYVTMLGLDAAGKTTILHKLKCGETKRTIPTVGVSVQTVKPCKGLTMTVWDVGGQSVLRPLWQHYMKETDGLIYVVDSSDEQRFEDARDELYKILAQADDQPEFPILILANKMDLPHARPATKIEDALTLYKLKGRQHYHVESCCATTGEGLMDGLKWFAEMIRDSRRLHDRAES